MTKTLIFLLVISGLYAREFNSDINKAHLVELYTSESCSSCPPAEKWLSRFKGDLGLWKRFVPVSYHVSYWNYLHWKDSFSKDEFSRRQRKFARAVRSGVYTPQIVIDGKDARSKRSKLLSVKEKVGVLKAKMEKEKVTLHFTPIEKQKELVCSVALLGSGFATKVTSGENKGRTIKQDFVVLDIKEEGMQKSSQEYSCSFDISSFKKTKAPMKNIAFWVRDKKTWKVIQSTGGLYK